MIVDQKVVIPAPPERVWDLMMDVPEVATCVPGVESVEQVGDDEYAGALRVRVGKIAVRLEGKVTVVDRDKDSWSAGMNVEAVDRKIRGSVKAKSTMKLEPQDGGGATELLVHADASILGKLGEFGQAVMRRKAEQIVGEFAQNVARKIEGTTEGPVTAEPAAVGARAPAPAREPAGEEQPARREGGRWRAFFRRLRARLRRVFRRA